MLILFDILLLALLAWIVFDAVRTYRATIGTVWDKLLAAGKDSATILWARFTVLIAALVNALVWLADVLNQPQVSIAIKTYLTPQLVAGIMIAIAFITELARRRTLKG